MLKNFVSWQIYSSSIRGNNLLFRLDSRTFPCTSFTPWPKILRPSNDPAETKKEKGNALRRIATVTLEDSVWQEEGLTLDFLFLVAFAEPQRSLLCLQQLYIPVRQSWTLILLKYMQSQKNGALYSFACISISSLRKKWVSSLIYCRGE